MAVYHNLPEGARALELNIGPVSGKPYLEVDWPGVRVLAMFDPERSTVVDAAWASDHPDLCSLGTLAGSRIGGLLFDRVRVTVVDLAEENDGRAWPTPMILGAEIADQADFYLDTEHAAWCVQR